MLPAPFSELSSAEMAVYWLIAANFFAFAAFGFDKAQAQLGAWRTSENALLGWAFVGGTFGAYAGRALFRHKTKKRSFSNALHRVTAFQLVALAVVGGWWLAPPELTARIGAAAREVSGNYTLLRSPEDIRESELSVTYTGCDEVRELGRAPLLAGQPGYRASMDGDGDGVACEPHF